jgi:hypothetical protein
LIDLIQFPKIEFDASKKELEVAHASPAKDLEHLEVTIKLVKVELLKLREVAHNEVLGTIYDPILFYDIACDTTLHLFNQPPKRSTLCKRGTIETRMARRTLGLGMPLARGNPNHYFAG